MVGGTILVLELAMGFGGADREGGAGGSSSLSSMIMISLFFGIAGRLWRAEGGGRERFEEDAVALGGGESSEEISITSFEMGADLRGCAGLATK